MLDRSQALNLDTHDVVCGKEGWGFCPMPTPDGVPVRITSPGASVHVSEMNSISSGTVKMRLLVLDSWRSSPFTHVRKARLWGSGISFAVVIHGPNGQKPSAPFARGR